MGDDDIKLLIADLAAAFKQGKRQLDGVSHILAALPFAFVLICIYRILQDVFGSGVEIVFFWLPPVVYFLVLFITNLAANPQRERLKKQLPDNTFLDGVLRGGEPGIDINQAVPRPFRIFLLLPKLPARFTDPRLCRLWRICYNLDWYLNPAKCLFRPAWVALIWLAVLSAMLFNALFRHHFPAGAAPWPDAAMLVLSIIPGLIVSHDVIRRHQWTILLLNHLKAVQEAAGDEPAAVS